MLVILPLLRLIFSAGLVFPSSQVGVSTVLSLLLDHPMLMLVKRAGSVTEVPFLIFCFSLFIGFVNVEILYHEMV